MTQKNLNLILFAIIVILIGVVGYFTFGKKAQAPESVTYETPISTSTTPTTGVEYKNIQYGFGIALPESWKGYSIVEDEWGGYSLDWQKYGNSDQSQVITEHGPIISIRHPDWEYKSPRQDIPIMVFTIKQWGDLLNEKFHIGAAPIDPSEIGRNSRYVFAVPARYNYAFLLGYEEVDQILKNNSFITF